MPVKVWELTMMVAVAVPLSPPQHSPMFGHFASSQTWQIFYNNCDVFKYLVICLNLKKYQYQVNQNSNIFLLCAVLDLLGFLWVCGSLSPLQCLFLATVEVLIYNTINITEFMHYLKQKSVKCILCEFWWFLFQSFVQWTNHLFSEQTSEYLVIIPWSSMPLQNDRVSKKYFEFKCCNKYM